MKRAIYSVVLMLIAVLLWQCARERVEPVSSGMAKELALLPPSTSGLAYLNLEKMRQSPFYEMMQDSLRNHMRQHREFDDFQEATGFDIREDVNEVYVAFDPDPRHRQGDFLMVAIANYDPQKLADYIKDRDEEGKLSTENYNDFELYRIGDKDYVFCFASANYMVGGKEEMVTAWLDNFKNGKGDAAAGKEIMERIKQVKYKNGGWFLMNTAHLMDKIMDEMGDQEHMQEHMRRFDALRSVQNVHMSMDVNNEIKFDGAGKFSDAEKAQLFHDAIKGALATVKLSLSGDRDAVDVINKIHIKTDHENVRIDGKMTRDDVEKIINHRRALAVR